MLVGSGEAQRLSPVRPLLGLFEHLFGRPGSLWRIEAPSFLVRALGIAGLGFGFHVFPVAIR